MPKRRTNPAPTSDAPDVAGISAAAVRSFLHQSAESDSWTVAYLAKALLVETKKAAGVLAALEMAGYIEPDGDAYRNTEAGNAVAQVSKAKPVKKKTADQALESFLERVRNVNLENQYLYAVDRVALFGPYFEGAEKFKDVDVAVELTPKEPDPAQLDALVKKQAEDEAAAGKRFKSFADRRAWGRNKVLTMLKGKTRALALYDLDETILARPHKIVYTRESPLRGNGGAKRRP